MEMSEIPESSSGERHGAEAIHLPAPTPWPLVLSFGVTLGVAGLVTTAAVSVLGAVLFLAGAIGWFREVLPHEHHESVPLQEEKIVIATSRKEVEEIEIAPELRRLRVPVEIYPIAAGIRGGLAGALAMAVVAMAYGWFAKGSIWYPVNLLGAVVYAHATQMSVHVLSRFNVILLLVALALHLTTSVLVGLLYGTMLPMLPRRPVLLGGVIGPILWSGLVYSVLGIVNPVLNARIDWWWFVASQVAFGCVAGIEVARHTKVRVRQLLPLAMRAGIEATGIPSEPREGDEQR